MFGIHRNVVSKLCPEVITFVFGNLGTVDMKITHIGHNKNWQVHRTSLEYP